MKYNAAFCFKWTYKMQDCNIKTLEDVKKVPVMYLKIQPPMRKLKREKIPDL